MPKDRIGVLLVNTGSSAAPRTAETRVYLRQFLSDPRIIDIAAWKRWIIVNCFILPFRPQRTAEAYQAIWTERGSPLIALSEDFRNALRQELPDAVIEIGMAYGTPSIAEGMDRLLALQLDRLIVVPMFPQYASATSGSVSCGVFEHASKQWNVPAITILPEFYDDPPFLDAWEHVAQEHLDTFKPDHVLLSYHGLPERHIYKGDPFGQHCLRKPDCCEVETTANRHCYRRQCLATSRALVERLGLQPGGYTVAFQSRLGRDPWLSPATDETIAELARKGVKRLAVLSPAFVADCLETLEEIGMQGKETFHEHGGEDYLLVPSLNTHPTWVKAMAGLLQRVAPNL